MTARLAILTCGLLFTHTAFSQTPDYSRFLTSIEVGSKPVSLLRVPPDQVNSKIQSYVYNAQWQLDRNLQFFKEGRNTEFGLIGQIEMDCHDIQKEDSLFPVQYYRDEVKAYMAWTEANNKREIEKGHAIAQHYDDSIHIENLKKGYRWINADSVWVRIKPDAKSPAIGRLLRLSYIKAYAVEGNSDWAEIDFASHTGYILRRELALRWEDMKLSSEELEELKSGRYYSFSPTAAYKAKLDREAAAEQRAMKAAAAAAPRRNYIRGPKGGCYFINSNGNKEYVSRSLCD